MEENQNNLIIEVRKPEDTVEEIPDETKTDNEVVEKIESEPEKKIEDHFEDIQAQIEKFQEEVSKFQDKIGVTKEKEDSNKIIEVNDIEKTQEVQEVFTEKKETPFHVKADVTSNEITSTAQGITDAIVQRVTNEKEDKKNITFHFNSRKELTEINCKTIYEFKKTVENFDINKVNIYNVEEDGKIISFLCHDGDFFAINRINFPDGYTYTEKTKPQLSENLNSKIRKIPNVAKTRNILKISDIETRIFDMTQYVLLLSKKGQEVRILKVSNGRDISDATFTEDKFDKKEYIDIINDYEVIEEELDREENSFKNRFSRVKEKLVTMVVNPFKMLKEKLAKAKDVKMLSDGRHSLFDKED